MQKCLDKNVVQKNTKHTTVCCVKPSGKLRANFTVTNAMSINVKQRNCGD